MRKHYTKTALDALKKIKIAEFEDTDLKNEVANAHYSLFKTAKTIDADIEALRSAHLAPYEDELAEVDNLQRRLANEKDEQKRAELVKEINSHEGLSKAVAEFNKAYENLMNEEIEAPTFDGEKFREEYLKQDYDMAVVEALDPLFK